MSLWLITENSDWQTSPSRFAFHTWRIPLPRELDLIQLTCFLRSKNLPFLLQYPYVCVGWGVCVCVCVCVCVWVCVPHFCFQYSVAVVLVFWSNQCFNYKRIKFFTVDVFFCFYTLLFYVKSTKEHVLIPLGEHLIKTKKKNHLNIAKRRQHTYLTAFYLQQSKHGNAHVLGTVTNKSTCF